MSHATHSPGPLFPLGHVVATPGALEAVAPHPGFIRECVARHVCGDWGVVGRDDWKANDDALKDGSRVFSAYTTPMGQKVWVITEADRSSTCVLLPDEY